MRLPTLDGLEFRADAWREGQEVRSPVTTAKFTGVVLVQMRAWQCLVVHGGVSESLMGLISLCGENSDKQEVGPNLTGRPWSQRDIISEAESNVQSE
jgi:hypothetical protein